MASPRTYLVPLTRTLVLLASLAAANGCTRREPPRLIVLVTIDTLRADHLPIHGYPRDTSPFITELSASGIVFEAAHAAIATTAPSHASLFTSLYATQHGVTRNGQVLDQRFETLAERLSDAGYTTVAVASTNRHFLEAGIMQGFTHTDEPDLSDHRWYRPAAESVDAALDILATLGDASVFMWLHLFDPHTPYDPPADTLRIFMDAGDAESIVEHLSRHHYLDLDFYPNRDALLAVMNSYDAEIRHADAALHKLWRATSANVPPSESVWVVTSDHGEGLGNHGYRGHGRHIYREQLHVPLLFWGPGRVAAGVRVDALVSHLDIAPTILDLAGGERRLRSAEGRPLTPLLQSPSEHLTGRPVLAERRSYAEQPGQKWTLQDERYSFIQTTSPTGDRHELFDVTRDPYQTRDLAHVLPDVARRYRARLALITSELATTARASELVSEETLERLRRLGYIQ